MELSIIITSYKNPELLKICINSIRKNYSGRDYEIIVADSCTEEKTEMMMDEDYPEVKFLPFEKNVGFQQLVKEGFRASKGECILILNGDIIVQNDSIEILLDFLKNNPAVGIAGPKLLNFNGTLQYSCFRFYSPLTIIYRRTFLGKFNFAKRHLEKFLMKDFDHAATKEVDWLMGSALAAGRPAIEKVGLMDGRFKMYMEDTDWCRRFWESGYKVVYFPDSRMHHYHSRGSADKSILKSLFFNRLTRTHIASALKYFWKYAGRKIPRHN